MIQKSFKILISSLVIILLFCQFTVILAFPSISAQSYIVIDADSGRIIGSNNAESKLPMASTTKIMTTILALDSIEDLNKNITVPDSCVGIEGSSLYLRPKQKVSIIDLLYGTMLRSGNDAAESLAYAAGKTSEKFIQMMNDKAKELGAYNTNFMNPHGLHDDNHYTTAYDLAIISKYAMENDIFKEISTAKKYNAESLNTVLYNKNKVVHQYEYGSGIKIGYTKAAGRCLVASAEKEGTEVIVVVLNDNNWFQDSYKVFDWAFENFKTYKFCDKNQYVGRTSTGEPVFTDEEFTYLLTEEEVDKIKFKANISTPVLTNSGEMNYGTYDVYLGDEVIHTGELVGENSK